MVVEIQVDETEPGTEILWQQGLSLFVHRQIWDHHFARMQQLRRLLEDSLLQDQARHVGRLRPGQELPGEGLLGDAVVLEGLWDQSLCPVLDEHCLVPVQPEFALALATLHLDDELRPLKFGEDVERQQVFVGPHNQLVEYLLASIVEELNGGPAILVRNDMDFVQSLRA